MLSPTVGDVVAFSCVVVALNPTVGDVVIYS